MRLDPGRRSRYELLTRIASGGMATVYVARLHGLDQFSRLVAIKRPHDFVTANPRLMRQLRHEARIASMIHHPNVTAVLDVEEHDGELALVMDYVEGCTLKDLMDHSADTATPMDRVALRILLDVAAGLNAAHSLRDAAGARVCVLHRDVSPHNVLVGRDGVARLADFGIAKLATLDCEPTTSGVVAGKVAYMAPEYLSAKHFDAQSDLFSLAVVAWEALSGQRLFKGATAVETIMHVLHSRPRPLGEIRAELSALEEIIASALARDPAARPESVEAFASVLEATARSIDRVAAHSEVRVLVEQVAGEAMAKRRRAIIDPLERARLNARFEAETRTSARDDVVTASLASAQSDGTEEGHEKPAANLVLRGGADRRALIWTLASVAGIALLGATAIGARNRNDTPADATEKVPPSPAVPAVPSHAAAAPPPPIPSSMAPATPRTAAAPSAEKARSAREPNRNRSVKPLPPAASAASAPSAAGYPERAPANPYAQ
jgi:eukaryotic-like serine/threonine-protein kinase